MTRIKFCGMVRDEDVDLAVSLGVDAVGFVLWAGSPRHVDTAEVARLTERLPASILPVGVFVDPTADEVTRAVDAGIRAAQLHGLDQMPSWPVPCELWMAARLVADGYAPVVGEDCTLVLDSHDPVRHGGTGRPIDWTRAARVAATRRVVLAGGLTAANVAEAIRMVRPYAVDVASGIEDRPGMKNGRAMRDFVAAARQGPS